MDGNQLMAAFKSQLKQADDEFIAALPAHIPAERFSRVVLTAVQNNPKLLNLDRKSLFNAAMRSAQDGLLPDGREGAMVEFAGKVQWMPMIAGLRKKARNSGEIHTWEANVVYENDFFDYQLGDDPFIQHKPTLTDRGKLIAAYSVAKLKSGEVSREIMSIDEIHITRNRGSAWKAFKAKKIKSTPWDTDEAEMCRKTVARRHSKVLPMSTDLDDLMRRDDELYDIKTVSDANAQQDYALSDKMMAGAPPEKKPVRGQEIEGTAEEVHDTETGEVVDSKPEPKQQPKETQKPDPKQATPSSKEELEAAYNAGQEAFANNRRQESGPREPEDIAKEWVQGFVDAQIDQQGRVED